MKSSSKKRSQSETSFAETFVPDNCVDSILYRELREKREKLSRDCAQADRYVDSKLSWKLNEGKMDNVHLRRTINVDGIVNNFSDNARVPSLTQNRKYNLKHSINKFQSASRLPGKSSSRKIETNAGILQRSIIPVGCCAKTITQKQPKFLCKNCCCHAKLVTSIFNMKFHRDII